MEAFTKLAIEAAERAWLPDPLVRYGIRQLCKERLALESGRALHGATLHDFIRKNSQGPVAIATEDANAQHYEQPTELFRKTLGPRMKYSSCYWPEGVHSLQEAEEAALRETCRRARVGDGMEILELGCGWGSLTLWIAEHYPTSNITAVSNSRTQRLYIEEQARERSLHNVRVLTANMNSFAIDEQFDRVLSVEMFEHMTNHDELLRRVSLWMKPAGLLFVHVFAHRRFAYSFQAEGPGDWMAQNFFTGGMMPSTDYLPSFCDNVELAEQWWWDGKHYQRTAEAWLQNMDSNKRELIEILSAAHGAADAERWFQRWRIFYLACAEMWGYREGQEWGVAHYLFNKAKAASRPAAEFHALRREGAASW